MGLALQLGLGFPIDDTSYVSVACVVGVAEIVMAEGVLVSLSSI